MALFLHFADLELEILFATANKLDDFVLFERFFVGSESFVELEYTKYGCDEVAEHCAGEDECSNKSDKWRNV